MVEARLHDGVLKIDCAVETDRIAKWMIGVVGRDLRRRGVVVALSGGVDSSVCAALAVRALGAGKVYGLMLPERDSSPLSLKRGKQVADCLGIDYLVEDIGPTLDSLGCYLRRDEAIRRLFPEYGPGWKSKIAIAGGRDGSFNYFNLVVQTPGGELLEKRMPPREYLQIVAATNFKQRTRKMIEYFHADRLNYAVIGTPNRLEYDQGFFVKNGDGAADLKPIAHLYKTQVYALASHLRIPEEISSAAPTTDTYSLEQGQDEFYFSLSYDKMDVALWSFNHGVSEEALASHLGLSPQQAAFVYKDIVAKRTATRYLHAPAKLMEPIMEPIYEPAMPAR
ncbi:NAD(+) synthase [Desulfurivibrio alkaliphilus]|uniref:NH(3)-dependent NAD(+) synthetase n=1 Tax=Desulfurivibrio alkaliphilus (strain DSM 19089 / UNIQEM U267 / AHT2) TaxID=589865 RepID=D6Z4G6_DESAT|nr:NAD(+) synthase [Desulfurivibrio alkaliphilus]ADH86441.1 NAD+ synthetase [Desulfurivibrio alkaliphilus AHT 2]